MCARAPVHRIRSITSAMARFSAPRGREAKEVIVLRTLDVRSAVDGPGVLGVHDHRGIEPRQLGEILLEFVGVEMGKP